MHSFTTFSAALTTALLSARLTHALDGIVVPASIAANTAFNATFSDSGNSHYRVYLAAALAGQNGPTCYLINSTTLSSPVNLTIPASVGPSADYYSIAIADTSSNSPASSTTYSNRFNLTGGTGQYTQYESHLGGAPFWSADDLPCASYDCARQCATASYPDDLTTNSAYQTMMQCILKCPGVTPAASQTQPAHGSASSSSATGAATYSAALVTLASGAVVTAVETVVTTGGSTFTEALIGSSMTVTLGGPAATVSSEVVSLDQHGLKVGSSTTVAFSDMVATMTVTASAGAASATSGGSGAAATSKGAAVVGRGEVAVAGLMGVAGFAAVFL